MPVVGPFTPNFPQSPRTAIAAELRDTDPANPIAIEVARLIAAYTSNFKQHVERLGRIPPDILRKKPR